MPFDSVGGREEIAANGSKTSASDDNATHIKELIQQLERGPKEPIHDEAQRLSQVASRLEKAVRKDPRNPDHFRHGKGFQIVLDLVQFICANSEASWAEDSLVEVELVARCLAVIAIALRDHRGNQKLFNRHLRGWTTLERCLAECPGLGAVSQARRRICSCLLHLAVEHEDVNDVLTAGIETDAATSAIGTKSDIVHPEAARIAVSLACASRGREDGRAGLGEYEELAAAVLSTVHSLAAFSIRNTVLLWQTDLLGNLLPIVFTDDVWDEVKSTAKDLALELAQLGLGTLDQTAVLFRQARDSDSAKEILLDILRQSKAPSCVHFDLSRHGYSSIELPGLPRTFPSSSGYTLTAWLRIDEYDANSHTTLFGAFDASQSCFVLIYLEKDSRQLILQTSVRSSRPSVRFKRTRLAAGQWYHIALVHRRANDAAASPAMLFVNGDFTEQVRCAYPEAPAAFGTKHGRSSRSRSPTNSTSSPRPKPVQAFFGTPHDLAGKIGRDAVLTKWSLASAHLYSVPLTDEYVAVHYRLSPRYIGNMQDCLGPLLTYRSSAELNRYNELLHPDKSDKSDIVTATEGRGSEVVHEARLLLSINAAAVMDVNGASGDIRQELDRNGWARFHQLAQTTSAIAINLAVPTLSEAISRSYGTGVLAGDPVPIVRKPLDDAVWCLAGGLPLLIGLLDTARTKSAFLLAVKIYMECVMDNWRISEALEKGNGFGMLALIIREKLGFETGLAAVQASSRRQGSLLSVEDRQELPYELLQVILTFVGYEAHRPENSMIVNPMAYRMLLVDFDTWRRCDAKTQELYYDQFLRFLHHNRHQSFNAKRLLRMRVVRKLIEAMKSEDVPKESIQPLMKALRALIDNSSAGALYKDLAMFVSYGLQEEKAQLQRTARGLASVVSFRQRAASWARSARGSRPTTPGVEAQTNGIEFATRAELAVQTLRLLSGVICDQTSATPTRRFNRAVPNRWLLHLLAEPQPDVSELAMGMIAHSFFTLRTEFRTPFVERNSGWLTLRSRLRAQWRSPTVWVACFSTLFGQYMPVVPEGRLNAFALIDIFKIGPTTSIANAEALLTLTTMLEAGLRMMVKDGYEPTVSETSLLKAIIQFLSELYSRSEAFREFAVTGKYTQELLFVLYPILVGSDRLPASAELDADKGTLSFAGEEVKMRPHSNSLGGRPPSVRSIDVGEIKRTPSPLPGKGIQGPRRLSSFVMVNPNTTRARFKQALAPKSTEPVQINVGNELVESLLEVVINLFIDLVCNKADFQGIGVFLKVPPGFREHQAYFESYLLVNCLSQLWNHLKLNQTLLLDSKVLKNLSRFSTHISEAVFEGWFIDGAQPVLDFTGHLLEYLQQPEVSDNKQVRLCSQFTSNIRVIFLRVTLWRLSDLDSSSEEMQTVEFIDKMNYWQTILFSSENQETLFIRLICFLLYLKLVLGAPGARLAAARLWRTILVQKPTTSATLLSVAMGAEQKHLSTGFMKLVEIDDEDFVQWIDDNRKELDAGFLKSLNRPWDDFVEDENARNAQTAQHRLDKRREKLRQWQSEESAFDEALHRYEVATNHWRQNVHGQERQKLSRAAQDYSENLHHLHSLLAKLDQIARSPAGLDPDVDSPKWQLDETEARNRMRLRTIRDYEQKSHLQPRRKGSQVQHSHPKLAISTQLTVGAIAENINSSIPPSPLPTGIDGNSDVIGRSRAESASNSQLLEGAFEIVDDPNEGEDGVEDKNRKIMTSLQRNDMVQQLYNISRIVGLEACEGLLVVGKDCLYLQDNYFQRSDGEIVYAWQAPEDERDPYVQLISGKDIGSQRTKHSLGDTETRHWTWSELLSVSKRRFLFRDVSIEVFFTDGRSYLLTCLSTKIRDDLYAAMISRAPHIHNSSAIASEDAWRLDNLVNPEEVPQSLGTRFVAAFNNAPTYAATKKWVKGEMSNFQYLMLINTMAGRTFNDLTQYPVFPWVIADWTSEELTLRDPKVFRDLTKPMGCQTPAREAEFRERYKQFADMGDDTAPPFHYGTHYSSAMIVSSYLIRLQPFVQSYLLLQGGSFDHADRLFDSIGKAWLSASQENMTDVRELTPEFFYLPEAFVNINKYDFGVKQSDGLAVDHVQLPPWAKGDPEIFIAKHREALESPYVSWKLHAWIDLVFGYKQRGEAAVAAANVFNHLSYQGARDLDAIDDPVERLASIGIINNFGQTPYQVFSKPHPAREVGRSALQRLDIQAEYLVRLPDPLFESNEKVCNLTFAEPLGKLLCAGPARLELAPRYDRYVQWNFADNSIRSFSSNTKRLVGLNENMHIGPISAAVLADSKTLVTGGADCTIGVWAVNATKDLVDFQMRSYLFGHRKAITILSASRVFSTLLSVSSDGHALLWGLNRLNCIRVLLPPGGPIVQSAKISNLTGHVAICHGPRLSLYTINGHLLVQQKIGEAETEEITCCAFYEGAGNEYVERELILTGHANGVANVWALTTLDDGGWHLQLLKRLNHVDGRREDGGNTVAAITAILPMPAAVYTGDELGKVWEWDCVPRSGSQSVKAR